MKNMQEREREALIALVSSEGHADGFRIVISSVC